MQAWRPALALAGAQSDSGQRRTVASQVTRSLHGNPERPFLATRKRQGRGILAGRVAGPSVAVRVLPLDFSGVCLPRAPSPAACSLTQSVNKQSLRLPHACQCTGWPLSKPVTGAASGPSGKAAHPQHDVPCSTIPELGLLCPLEASLLILVACALASTICVQ